MKDTIRLFVAVALPEQLKKYLAQQVKPFQHEAVRLVPEQNLHLTLFFIGNTPSGSLTAIKEKIAEVATRHHPFDLRLHNLEPGPKPRSPRLVWARFEQSQLFEELSQDLTLQLSAEPPRQQKHIPHVTLARFRKDKPLPPAMPTITPDEAATLQVEAVSLWQSELSSPHPRYSILETYPLS